MPDVDNHHQTVAEPDNEMHTSTNLCNTDPYHQLAGPLLIVVGPTLLGDAEQDAKKDAQGNDGQWKITHETEIMTCQRLRLGASASLTLPRANIRTDTSTTSILPIVANPLHLRISTPMELSHPPTVLPINDSLYHGSIQPTSPLRRLHIIPKTPTRSQSATTSEHPIDPSQRTYRQLHPSVSLPRSLPSIPVSNLQRRQHPCADRRRGRRGGGQRSWGRVRERC